MKVLIFIFLFINSLFAYNITCKGDLGASTFYDFSKLPNSSILALEGELSDGYIYGEIDPANSFVPYYDDSSPVCGGDGDKNILIDAYCSWRISECWDIVFGKGSVDLIIQEDGIYKNNVIVVNTYPCLPRNVSSFTVGFYDYDTYNDMGFAKVNLSHIDYEYIQTPTKEEATIQRNTCKVPTKPEVDLIPYVDDWENLLYNQILTLSNLNNNINLKSFDFTLNNLDLTIQDDTYTNSDDISTILSNFSNNYNTTLNNSFNIYSNAFGFGDYGSAPTPIKFNLLGHSYSAFDVTQFDNEIPFIRFSLLSFSYVWGFIIAMRMTV